MRTDCTQSFRRYRELFRMIWNGYFASEPALCEPEPHFLFHDAAARLFEALIFLPFSIYVNVSDRYRPGMSGDFMVHIAVTEASLAVNARLQSEPVTIYGRPTLPVRPGEAELRFISFFDWDEMGPRQFSFLEVRIERLDSHPDLVGRHAIIDMDACSIWLEYEVVEAAKTSASDCPDYPEHGLRCWQRSRHGTHTADELSGTQSQFFRRRHARAEVLHASALSDTSSGAEGDFRVARRFRFRSNCQDYGCPETRFRRHAEARRRAGDPAPGPAGRSPQGDDRPFASCDINLDQDPALGRERRREEHPLRR